MPRLPHLRRAPAPGARARLCSDFASSTLNACTERSICRSRPLSTRPGPTSTNVVAPCSINSRMDSSQRTGKRHLAHQRFAGLVAAGDDAGVDVGDQRNAQGAKRAWRAGPSPGALAPAASIRCGKAPKPAASRRAWRRRPRLARRRASPPRRGRRLPSARANSDSRARPPVRRAALRQISATWPGRSPRIAAMAPSPAGTASCMYFPRRRTRRTASANASAPAATSAEYSPKLWPATKSGRTPFSSRTR